jgi:CRISPR-associated endonuclease/helicase Cas3
MAIGHTRNELGARQDLVDHLQGVAYRAAEFADAFGAAEVGRWLGLYHDVGKFDPDFQRYLLRCEEHPELTGHGPDHKAAGAQLARDHLGTPFSLIIQGHHGGLRSPAEWNRWLTERGASTAPVDAIGLAKAAIPDLIPGSAVRLPGHIEVADQPLQVEVFVRLLFSALVDADSLDTEAHYDRDAAASRGGYPDLATLERRLARAQRDLMARARASSVGRERRRVYEACLAAADQPPGVFRLTVPTGGGKTRSAISFGLRHALRNGQRGIVVAVPYLTITEQTADVYRSIFDDEADAASPVLEHHSEARELGDDSSFDRRAIAARLAAENWDAPIVVTTTVQLFESLFSNRRGRCRKLHRLAGSVIVLDEAQALPAGLLRPILDGLRELVSHYGVSVVLSTATQPSFETIPEFAEVPATEIVPRSRQLFGALRRVNYEWLPEPIPWRSVADRLCRERQALVVTNTRVDARKLLDALSAEHPLHLSTSLCGAHRRDTLAEIRRRLDVGEPCLVVATQVVEAGVDLDFPVVWRAVGPLDGIIQAAGRCNREGNRPVGRVVVFEPEDGRLPRGSYTVATQETLSLLQQAGGNLDLDDPEIARAYFRALYPLLDADSRQVQRHRAALDYPEVAQRVRFIEQTDSVIVPYGDRRTRETVERLTDGLIRGGRDGRIALRRLQPYLVSLQRHLADRYGERGLIEPVLPGVGRWLGDYDPIQGLIGADPVGEQLVV